jgi:hypothetical protein
LMNSTFYEIINVRFQKFLGLKDTICGFELSGGYEAFFPRKTLHHL